MKKIRSFNHFLSVALAFLFLAVMGCSKDDNDSPNGQLSIGAKSTLGSLAGKTAIANSGKADVVVTKFLMNLKEFELEVDLEDPEDDMQGNDDMQWDDDGYYDFEDEIELEGPYELDLLAGQVSFLNVSVPMGNFEELEFKFDAGTDPDSEMFGRSVLIEGTYMETPFIFWHNFEDEVEVDFEDPQFDIAVSETPEGIVIDFDLSLVLDSANGVDLSQAADGNEDGTIEISPEDPDGNNAIAQAIRNNIKEFIDLLDD